MTLSINPVANFVSEGHFQVGYSKNRHPFTRRCSNFSWWRCFGTERFREALCPYTVGNFRHPWERFVFFQQRNGVFH